MPAPRRAVAPYQTAQGRAVGRAGQILSLALNMTVFGLERCFPETRILRDRHLSWRDNVGRQVATGTNEKSLQYCLGSDNSETVVD